MPLPPPFDARVLSTKALTPTVKEIAFERVDGQPMAFEAGQWVNLILPVTETRSQRPTLGEPTLKRSYSVASSPDGSPRFAIAVTLVHGGPASTWLHEVEPGTVIQVLGPQGFFVRPPASSPPSLMVATGTGVAPMRSMIGAAIAAGSPTPIWLLLGARREEDVLYGEEFASVVRAHPFVRFEATLSQPRGPWSGRRGYVQTHLSELWAALARSCEVPAHVYICGLQRMVGSVRDMFRNELGLPRQRVHAERYD
ncbi:MAG: FAD-dependent oxidoreductase [Myxococcota bacterium]|nr:FAD-dependent oxidoreductase [Myxococcota bacterium]